MGKMSESFIMYESFVDAIETLPPEDQLKAYRAISRYATKGEEPSSDIGVAYAIFLMAKPQLDANTNRRTNGGKGGRPKENHRLENEKPMVIETETYGFENENHRLENEKPNVNVNVNENVNENVNGKVKEKHPRTPSFEDLAKDKAISEPVKDAVREWLEYKKERREPYKAAGYNALLTQIEKAEREHGASAVINLIHESMANGWRGIIWDRLKKPKKELSLAEQWGITDTDIWGSV
jgi:hypothetical protein